MNYLYYLKFIKLRRLEKIGRLWIMPEGFKLAPQNCFPTLEYQMADWITLPKLEILIDVLMSVEEYQNNLCLPKIGPKSAALVYCERRKEG